MKHFILLISALISVPVFATPGIHEALKNPSAVTVLKFSGEKDEAALFTKNANRFGALTQIIISGISDSISAEQDISAVAACPSVYHLNFENCGVQHLSGAMSMLVSVNEVEISNCKKLNADDAFAALAGMPSLKILTYETDQFKKLPSSFAQMKSLEKISIRNNDLSLADGYALNNFSPESLFVKETLNLGFGANQLTLEYGCYDKTSAQEHISIMRDMLQGVAGMSDEMPLPQRAAAFTRINPLIHPPIAGLEVRKNIYTTDAISGGEIQYPSGTKIFIPANAFVDANGNEVKGDVTIDYREFRDQVDILISGIPMQYDSAGSNGEFQSAGMFEMNASVNGKEVFLAPGKKVDMQFAVVDTASTYNFYKLDENKGWQYIQQTGSVETTKDSIQVNPVYVSNYSQAIEDFKNKLIRPWWAHEPSIKDTTSFERVYEDTNYFYTSKRVPYKNYVAKNVYKDATRWKMKKISSPKNTFCFKFTGALGDVDYNGNNNEMNFFGRTVWMMNDNLDAATLRQFKSRRSGISDMRMSYNGGSEFSLELKLPNGFKTVSLTAVNMVNDKPVPLPEKQCEQMNHRYEKALTHREHAFNSSINARLVAHANYFKKLSSDSLKAWNSVKKEMNDKEKVMAFPDWKVYVDKTKSFEWTTQSNLAQAQHDAIYQALSIMNFGVFNCDQVQRIHNPVEVNAFANLPDGKKENATQMFVVDQNHNMALSYQGYEGNSIHIAFGKDSKNKLIVVNADGTVSCADENEFKAQTIDSDGNTRFETTRTSDKPLTAQQLRQFIYPENMAQK
jgi:hypothetical protein